MPFQVWVSTEKASTKAIKTIIEELGFHDKARKIRQVTSQPDQQCHYAFSAELSSASISNEIATTIYVPTVDPDDHDAVTKLRAAVEAHDVDAKLLFREAIVNEPLQTHPGNPVSRAVWSWLQGFDLTQECIQNLTKSSSWNYQIYQPMLLLGPQTFDTPHLVKFVDENLSEPVEIQLQELYKRMCEATDCTHLAQNAPIPLSINAGKPGSQVNQLRSPSALRVLYGSFGDYEAKASPESFERALWVTSIQNGITQTFAPLYTMFSRGNIKEKGRILQLARTQERPYTAIDLYAGIGYFAFSYAKGGAAIILGWEINDWSVEGFRRGCEKNAWSHTIVQEDENCTKSHLASHFPKQGQSNQPHLVMFKENNKNAAARVKALRDFMPPVRHVNCGYLPSSRDSWAVAVQCFHPGLSGVIHVHENVSIMDIDTRKQEVEDAFRILAEDDFGATLVSVTCRHVEKIKSYAPSIWHCVFDIEITCGGLSE